MKNTEWNSLRTRVHHDWLGNRYISFLEAYRQIDKNDYGDGMVQQLLSWEKRRKDFLRLLENAEEALSPRQLLQEPPFDSMCKEDRQWLGVAVHCIFCRKTGIRKSVSDIRIQMDLIDILFVEALGMISVSGIPSYEVRNQLFNSFCRFSQMISELPHEVQI